MENQTSMDDRFLTLIHQYIEENLGNEHFSVEDLAEKASLSRSMLHRRLVKLTGKSASALITEKRLLKAKELLENNTATASEIAYRVGFNSPSYFNSVFKKHFRISPGNVKKTLKADPDYFKQFIPRTQDTPRSSSKKKLIIRMVIASSVLILVGLTIVMYLNFVRFNEKSIAVLPLNNLTGFAENAYLVDGIQDALIGELGKITSLRVISRTSTMRYRDTDKLLKDIAEELGVNAIVEGSVLGADDSLRILIQLIDVYPKERHLLAREYRENMTRILNLQGQMARDIAQKTNIRLTRDEAERLTDQREVNPDTYRAYLRGMYYLNQGTAESFEEGIKYFYEAIDNDPGDPFAYAAMALGYAHIGHGQVNYQEAFNRLESSARKAIKLDPNSDEAHTALAIHHLYNTWDWEFIREAFENALRNNPNNEIAHAHYAWYHILFGDEGKAVYHARKAVMLEPFSSSYTSWLAMIYYNDGDYSNAEYWAKRSIELNMDSPYGKLILSYVALYNGETEKVIALTDSLPDGDNYWKMLKGYNYTKIGQREKAQAYWAEFEEEAKSGWVNNCYRGMMAAYLGYQDIAFEEMNQAITYKLYPVTYINFYPMFENLRNDPRYQELLQKMNLPYQTDLLSSQH